jgi:hypothetical protein
MRRTRSAGVAGWAVALALVAGCGVTAGQVEFVVYFTPEATDQQKDAVRNACPGVGRATLEPRDRSDLQTARTYPVRYDISKASSQERAAVIRCVSMQPGVRGISQSDNGT